MKKIILFTWLILAVVVLLTRCDLSKEHEYIMAERDVVKARVVAGKESAIETHTESEYNWSKGAWYDIPYTGTVYYVVYSDGHTEKVDVAKYTTTKVGDTVFFKTKQQYQVKNPNYVK